MRPLVASVGGPITESQKHSVPVLATAGVQSCLIGVAVARTVPPGEVPGDPYLGRTFALGVAVIARKVADYFLRMWDVGGGRSGVGSCVCVCLRECGCVPKILISQLSLVAQGCCPSWQRSQVPNHLTSGP